MGRQEAGRRGREGGRHHDVKLASRARAREIARGTTLACKHIAGALDDVEAG